MLIYKDKLMDAMRFGSFESQCRALGSMDSASIAIKCQLSSLDFYRILNSLKMLLI